MLEAGWLVDLVEPVDCLYRRVVCTGTRFVAMEYLGYWIVSIRSFIGLNIHG